jgi:steroid delta-isomerase
MDHAHMVAVVEGYMDAFNTKDISIIRGMYAPDARIEDPVGTEPHVGLDAILGFYEAAIETGPTLSLSGQVRCAGNSAAFPFQSRRGSVTMDIIDVFDFNEDGKVVSMRAYWSRDNLTRE